MLIENQDQFLIHQRNLQFLVTEIFRVVNEIAPSLMKPFF